MANFVDRWLERVTERYPYAVPTTLLVLGILVIGYAGSFVLEWYELGRGGPVIEESKAPPGDVGKGVAADLGDAAAEQELAGRMRLRRGLLLTGGGVLLVIGSMSIAYSVFWFRLARLKRPEDDDAPPRWN